MSSFLAHSIVGITIGSKKNKKSLRQSITLMLFFIVLASTPDIDYLINYIRGLGMPMRYTHSIGFVFLVGIFSLVFRNILLKKYLHETPVILFFLAPFSHLVLDALVGVHANPYFFPLSSYEFVLPFGILPSSGRINIHNFYFWRNMFIEIAIFLPILVAFVPSLRKYFFQYKVLKLMLIMLFVVGVSIGINLDRT